MALKAWKSGTVSESGGRKSEPQKSANTRAGGPEPFNFKLKVEEGRKAND
ncbi:hypothetical protein ACFL1Z_06025 [Thermodesulfobacteriota bacterium]